MNRRPIISIHDPPPNEEDMPINGSAASANGRNGSGQNQSGSAASTNGRNGSGQNQSGSYIKNIDGSCGVTKLQTIRFDERKYCYETSPTANVMSAHPKTFYINESMRLYHSKYVRLPFAIP
uniref:Uncharacterized protein n=1 Tax=Panagrolaimus sp. PS1159 TaxID=55785 RepID=A0AC35GL24_9BILA